MSERTFDLADDAALAGELVRAAGRLAREMREAGLETEHKSSVSDVVTEADRAAERMIADRLAVERPDDGILGEEGGPARESRSGRTWVIDPVDGTYNFVQGLDWWCSAIALVEGDPEDADPLLGAIYHPAADRLYVGGPTLATSIDGRPVEQPADRSLADACVTTYLHPPFYGDEVGVAFGRVVGRAATLRMLGSGSMDLTLVAQGLLHVSCQHSVPPWDRLPGAALVLGAGGTTRRTEAAGKRWTLTGAPTAVAEACAALEAR